MKRYRYATQLARVYPNGVTLDIDGPKRRRRQSSKELKYFDAILGGGITIPFDAFIFESMNLIQQGVADNQRIGRKVHVERFQYTYGLSIASVQNVSAARSDIVRVIIYEDLQCNGAAASVFDILETDSIFAFRKMSNIDRFNILHEAWSCLNPVGIVAACGCENITVNAFVTMVVVDIPVDVTLDFSGTTGAIDEIRSSNIGVLLISRFGVATIDHEVRIRYTDG